MRTDGLMGTESENQEQLDELRRKIQTMSNEELAALVVILKRQRQTTPEEMEMIGQQAARNVAAHIARSRQH